MSMIFIMILLPIISGFAVYFIGRKSELLRDIISISISAIELIMMLILMFVIKQASISIEYVFGIGLSFKIDGFRCLYALISIFLWLMTLIFSHEYMKHYENKNRYYMFYLWTLGSVIGVFLSNDLFTTFVFFEMMSLVSYVLVMHDEKPQTQKASTVYLTVSIITGMVLLMGLFILYASVGSLDFVQIKEFAEINGLNASLYGAGICLLIGFGAKAGMYPLHIWLPQAHPVAPAPASALLSGILTKTGVFGVIIIAQYLFIDNTSFGIILLVIAVITMFLGAVLALFSVDLKRTIACSSMSQIGFILVGIATCVLLKEESILASSGAILHMMNHSLIKLVLFIIAGVVVMNIHQLDLNEIRGFGRGKWLIAICFAICGLSLAGVPLFSGYISKTLLHEAIIESLNLQGYYALIKISEAFFVLTGGLTLAYMLKLFICIFIEENENKQTQEKYLSMNKTYLSVISKIVIAASTLIILLIGFMPNKIMGNIAIYANDIFNNSGAINIEYYSLECLKGAAISIAIGIAIYFAFVRTVLMKSKKYVTIWPDNISLINVVYIPMYKVLSLVMLFILKPMALAVDALVYVLNKAIFKSKYYKFEEKSLPYRLGAIIDNANMSLVKKKTDNQEAFDRLYRMFNKQVNKISNSFSYSLMTFCIGLALIVIFLLLV